MAKYTRENASEIAADWEYDVFISSSPADRAWVQTWLKPRLIDAHIAVCTEDRFDIGVPTLINIENAISASRHVVLVLTPAWMKDEWQYLHFLLGRHADPASLQQRIVPVIRRPCRLPPLLASLTAANLVDENEAEFHHLLQAIRGIRRLPDAPRSAISRAPRSRTPATQEKASPQSQAVGLLCHAPPPLTHFVERPEALGTLKASVMAGKSAAGEAPLITVIHGLPGVGKSTLAAALAHDPAIHARFDTGVLWVTLGRRPSLLAQLNLLIQALGDKAVQQTHQQAATNQLFRLLKDKAFLLVIDDAWEIDHVRPFIVGGSRAHILITSREAVIAKAQGVIPYHLDVMTANQALRLIERRLGRALLSAEQPHAHALVHAVGCLPLALNVVAALVNEGVPWQDLLADLRTESARLENLTVLSGEERVAEQDRKRLNVLRSFALSIGRLSQESCRRFAWLGIVAADALLTPALAARLWDVDEPTAHKQLRAFHDKALLLPANAPLDSAPAYRLHGLLSELALDMLRASPAAQQMCAFPLPELSLPEAHAITLKRYQLQISQGRWHTLVDDGYIHAHLIWHMHKAEQPDAIHALLAEETSAGRNGWFETQDGLGRMASYVTDVLMAWQLTEQSATDAQRPAAIGRQCQYALIIASLHSLAKNIPPSLMARLVQEGVWSIERGLAYARHAPNANQRAQALIALAPHLSKPALPVALETLQNTEQAYEHIDALVQLAPHLIAAGYAAETLQAAQRTADPYRRGMALAQLVAHLPDELRNEVVHEAIQAAQQVKEADRSVELLKGLCVSAVNVLALPEVRAIVRTIADPRQRGAVVGSLASHIAGTQKEELLQETIDAIRAIADPYDRVMALAPLAPHCAEPHKAAVAEQARDALKLIRSPDQRHTAATYLTLQMDGGLRPLEDLLSLESAQADPVQGSMLHSRPSPDADPTKLRAALQAAQAINDADDRAAALASLACAVAESQHASAALTILASSERLPQLVMRLAARAAHLPEALQHEIFRRGLLLEAHQRTSILTALAPSLPASLLAEMREVAWTIPDRYQQASIFVEIAPRLADAALWNGLLESLERLLESERMTLLKRLLELGEPQMVLRGIRALPKTDDQLSALAQLTQPLLAQPQGESVQEAVELLQAIQQGARRTGSLDNVVAPGLELDRYQSAAPAQPQVIREARQQADAVFQATRTIQDPNERAQRLLEAASSQPSKAHIDEARQPAERTEDAYWRAKALVGLAPFLSAQWRSDVFQQALERAQAIANQDWRAKELKWLAIQWAAFGSARQAMEIALAIPDPARKVATLLELLAHLPEEVQYETLHAALHSTETISDPQEQDAVLMELARRFAKLGHVAEALPIARSLSETRRRCVALAQLAHHLSGQAAIDLLQQALEAVQELQSEYEQVHILEEIAPQLPKPLLQQALNYIPLLRTETLQAIVLAQLARRAVDLVDYSETLRVAQQIPDGYQRTMTLIAIIPSLSEELLLSTLSELHEIVLLVEDEGGAATILQMTADATPALPMPLLSDFLRTAQRISSTTDRTKALNSLVRHVNRLSCRDAYRLWCESLRAMAAGTRKDLLQDLAALFPILARLGGTQAVVETARAIECVGRWWP